jgi:hypothetical protein
MAVETTVTYDGPLSANGVTVAFPFTFKAMAAEEIALAVYDADDLAVDVENLPDYTVTLADPGGTVTFDTAPANGLSIYILSSPAFTQEIEFENGSRWLAGPVNEANDRAAVRALANRRDIDRAVLLPPGDEGVELPRGSGPTLYTSVNTLAAIASDITTVAENVPIIDIVATNLDGSNTIGTVATNIANVNAVGGSIANVNTVAGIAANVTTVAGIAANVTTVAGAAAHVATLAPIAANITTVAGIAANVTTVAGVSGHVTTLAPIAANITTVAGISANVTTVAGISVKVTTVADNIADVTTVADNIDAVNDAADNMAAIIAAPDAADRAETAADLAESYTGGVVEVVAGGEELVVRNERRERAARLRAEGFRFAKVIANLLESPDALINLLSFGEGVSLSYGPVSLALLSARREIALNFLAEAGQLEVPILKAGVIDAAEYVNTRVIQQETRRHEINMVVALGQSNSMFGYGGRTGSLVTNGYKFSTAGYNTYNLTSAPSRASLVPGDLTSQPTGSTLQGIQQRLLDADSPVPNPAQYRVFGTAPSTGGTPLSVSQALVDNAGVSGLTYLYADITEFLALAADSGWSSKILAFTYTGGEKDSESLMTRLTRAYAVDHLQITAEAMARTRTGQTDDVPLIISQMSSFNFNLGTAEPSTAYDPQVALGDYDAASLNYKILLACTTYFFDFSSPSHYTERFHRVLGQYYARAIYETVICGRTWEHVKPLASWRVGDAVYIKYQLGTGGTELLIDDSWVSDPGNYGFQLFEDDGTTEVTISAVEVLGDGCTVKLTCSTTPAAGWIMRYAFRFTEGYLTAADYGRLAGPRGCLRDNAGDTLTFEIGDGLGDWDAHNYAPIHDFVIS